MGAADAGSCHWAFLVRSTLPRINKDTETAFSGISMSCADGSTLRDLDQQSDEGHVRAASKLLSMGAQVALFHQCACWWLTTRP